MQRIAEFDSVAIVANHHCGIWLVLNAHLQSSKETIHLIISWINVVLCLRIQLLEEFFDSRAFFSNVL